MHDNQPPGSMNQKIFEMGLDVEPISLYLLVCAVADLDVPVTRSRLLDRWNGTPEAFETGLAELEKKNILRAITASPGDQTVYIVVDADRWQ